MRHNYLYDLALSIARHTVSIYVEELETPLGSTDFEAMCTSLQQEIDVIEAAIKEFDQNTKTEKQESCLIGEWRKLKSCNIADLYFTYGCLYFIESFQSFDYTVNYRRRLTDYYLEPNKLQKTRDLFNSCAQYYACCNNFMFDPNNFYFIRGFVAYILSISTGANVEDTANLAISNLSMIVLDCIDSGSFSLKIASLHLLCLLSKGSPASRLLLQELKKEVQRTESVLKWKPYIRAQESNLEPSDPNYYLFLAFKCLFNNDLEDAVEHLKEGLRENSTYKEHYYYLDFIAKHPKYPEDSRDSLSSFVATIIGKRRITYIYFPDKRTWKEEEEKLSYLKSRYLSCKSAKKDISYLENGIYKDSIEI